jgi:hypothetical protein
VQKNQETQPERKNFEMTGAPFAPRRPNLHAADRAPRGANAAAWRRFWLFTRVLIANFARRQMLAVRWREVGQEWEDRPVECGIRTRRRFRRCDLRIVSKASRDAEFWTRWLAAVTPFHRGARGFGPGRRNALNRTNGHPFTYRRECSATRLPSVSSKTAI